MPEPTPHRLPRTVVPREYDLRLAPDLSTASFDGEVEIRVEVVEATPTVVLNAVDLEISSASLADGTSLAVALDREAERAVLTAPEPLPVGPATLRLRFSGVLNDKLRGFYRSTFEDTDGQTRTIATTQFEATNARRAFPCWDEPDRKAVFRVTLDVADDLLAISCGPEVERTPLGDGRVRVRFAPTMVMSTYLLAFVVGPLEATPPVDVDGVPLRIVHPIGQGHLTAFGLEAGEFALRHFTNYFGIPYPGQKLDLVAVPDFAFGAMENLGCVTFREILLLVDPTQATQPELERAADVIAHEIAHMWFGDLVTMAWWEGIWLKEAFATFCEMHCTDAFRPGWHRWAGFGLNRTMAFDVDALSSTRPIEFEVVSPADAEAMYDVLTYEKGAAVVRMLEQYLGPEVFQAGVRHYLATHAYGNTRTTDLWDAIEESSREPVRATMDSWIYQGGFPLVTVERTGPASLRLRQQRFRIDGADDTTRWLVPVVLSLGGEGVDVATHRVLLDGPEADVHLEAPFTWVMANRCATGFYRVHYADDLRAALVAARHALDPVERYGLVDDSWAALQAGVTTAEAHLALVEALAEDEDDLAVWQRMVSGLTTAHHHLQPAGREAFAERARRVLRPAERRVAGATDERAAQVHATIVETLGVLGDREWEARARELLDAEHTSPPLRAAAVRIVAANGGPDEFAAFANRVATASSPQEEQRYLLALGTFPGSDEIERLLAMIEDGRVRSQDVSLVLARALGNSHVGPQVWSWVASHWDLIEQRVPDSLIGRIANAVGPLAEPDLARDIRAFFDDHPIPQAGKSLDQALERLDNNVELRARLRAELAG